jgi:hypothetical protein
MNLQQLAVNLLWLCGCLLGLLVAIWLVAEILEVIG